MMDKNGFVLTKEAIARRDLFGDSKKPHIRPFSMEDLWIFWAAYCEGSFPQLPSELSKEVFYRWMLDVLAKYSSVWLVEDDNKRFRDGRGVVCFIAMTSDGWKHEPHIEFFKWATKENILRVNVRFFNWVRNNKHIGVCVVKCLEEARKIFDTVRKKYGLLTYVGKICGGNQNGDEFIFSTRGKFGFEGRTNGTGNAVRPDGAESAATDAATTPPDASTTTSDGTTTDATTSPSASSATSTAGDGATDSTTTSGTA